MDPDNPEKMDADNPEKTPPIAQKFRGILRENPEKDSRKEKKKKKREKEKKRKGLDFTWEEGKKKNFSRQRLTKRIKKLRL